MANEREFTLVGKFDDQITKKLKAINEELSKLSKPLKKDNVASSLTKGFEDANKELKGLQKSLSSVMSSASSDATKVTKSFSKMTGSLDEASKSAGRVRDTVSQIGEGVKGLDGISESLEAAARAAGRAQEEVAGIGNAAGRANGQAESLINTLLKAEALSKIGDGIASGFSNGINKATNIAARGAGLIGKMFRESMEDELADVKAASGIQGSFGRAGYKGEFSDAQRTYKAFDREVSEMIKMSSAPTAKVIELQRYTLDTIGPLLLAAEGVQKGTAMKDIKPEAIQNAAKGYGKLLEKVAILGQGTGSAGFRVAGGIEQLVTRGKIDTTIDFFTDNILLMQNLQDAGFMGRQGTGGGKLMGATDADRLKAMMEAFEKSMSGEATAAMATSLTGSLQALSDVITNPSAGILGMSVSFGRDTQKKVNATVKEIYAGRIAEYQHELKTTKNLSAERRKQLEISIQQAIKTRDQLTKEGEERITTPFQAFSFSFSKVVQALTDALNSVGPVWENFAVVAIEFSEKALGPLADNLKAIASQMRAGEMGQVEGFGRIVGEIYKKIGQVMGDLATMLTSPTGAGAKVQSEFMKGFMSAFGEDPEQLKKAREAINKGINALVQKVVDMLKAVILSKELRPFVLLFFGAMFGPPMISAVVAGAIPVAISGVGGMLKAVFTKLQKYVTEGPGKSIIGKAGQGFGNMGERVGGGIRSFLGKSQYAGPIGPVPEHTFFQGQRTAFMRPGLSVAGKLATTFESISQAGMRFKDFFRGFLGKLAIVGAVITTITSLFQGKGLAESLAQGAGPLLGAALGAALIPFLGPFGPLIGSMIGGWIGSLEPVTSFLTGVFEGVGTVVSEVGKAFGDVFSTLAANVMDMWGIITNLIPGLGQLVEGFSALRLGILTIKIILFPIKATLDLVNVALQGLRIAALQFRVWVSSIPVIGGIAGDRNKNQAELDQAMGRFAKTISDNNKYYSWDEFSGANLEGARASRQTAAAAKASTSALNSLTSAASAEAARKNKSGSGSPQPWATGTNDTAKLLRSMQMLGVQDDPRAKALLTVSEKLKQDSAAARNAQASLWSLVQHYKRDLRYDNKTIWKQRDVQDLQAKSQEASRKVLADQKNLSAEIAKMPASMNKSIGYAMTKMSTAQIEYAIANKISMIPRIQVPSGSLIPTNSPSFVGPRSPAEVAKNISSARTPNKLPRWLQGAFGNAFGSANPFYGTLSEAINFEMANKPAGSHLVIANSSETIIPAAASGFGGGMKDVVSAIWSSAQQTSASMANLIEKTNYSTADNLKKGFSSTAESMNTGFDKNIRATNQSVATFTRQNTQVLQAIKAATAAGGFGMMGLGGGYGSGGVRIAGMLGNYIKKTGGAPGSIWEHPWHGGVRGRHAKNSYHYSGRAIDIGAYAYEQGGVISRIMEFNKKLGVRPVEFLHAGNDRNHQDHVHVAYAFGPSQPAFLPTKAAAEAWEKKMIPSQFKVKTLTTNTGEMPTGGSTTINAPITIYQQPNQDAEQLASIVAYRIGLAVNELRNHA